MARQHVAAMFSDSTGMVWVSTYEGHIITMDRGTVVDYPIKPDSLIRNVKAFAEHAPREIWAGGEGGLFFIDRGQFRFIRPAVVDSLKDVTGIVDTKGGGLWLNTTGGIIHVTRNKLDRALRDPSYRFSCEQFESSEGLPGQAEDIYPYPKAIQGTDGRLWFTATRGVAWIDPKETRRMNTIPPPVHIERIVVDRKGYEISNQLRLPAAFGWGAIVSFLNALHCILDHLSL